MEENNVENRLILSISGEVDHHRAKEILKQIEEKIDRDLPRALVLDLSALDFTDSSGIAVLLRVRRLMAQIHGSLEIIHVPIQAMRLFETAGLDKILNISPM